MSCRPESGRQRALGSPPRGSGREEAPGLVSISGRPGGGARLGPLQPGCCHRGPHLAGGWAGAVSLSGEASSAPAILSIGAGRLGRCPAVKCAGGEGWLWPRPQVPRCPKLATCATSAHALSSCRRPGWVRSLDAWALQTPAAKELLAEVARPGMLPEAALASLYILLGSSRPRCLQLDCLLD